jgi:hypothetical protein
MQPDIGHVVLDHAEERLIAINKAEDGDERVNDAKIWKYLRAAPTPANAQSSATTPEAR